MNCIAAVYNRNGSPVEAETLDCLLSAAPLSASSRYKVLGGAVALASQGPGSGIAQHEAAGLQVAFTGRLDARDAICRTLGLNESPATTDAEIILQGWLRWGEELPKHLIGDFAVILWDANKQRLYAFRDVIGLVSLYWTQNGQQILFSSHVEGLLACPDVSKEVDEIALVDYLCCIDSEADRTFYKHVKSVTPAHVMQVTANTISEQGWWQPLELQRIRYNSDEEYAEELRDLLFDAVKDRLRDTGSVVGAEMSGGLDSTSVVSVLFSLLQEQNLITPQVFSYDLAKYPDCSEQQWVEKMQQHWNFDVIAVPVGELRLLRNNQPPLPRLESPLTGWAEVINWKARRLSELGGKVMLTGHVTRYSRAVEYRQAYGARIKEGDFSAIPDALQAAKKLGRPMRWGISQLLIRPLLGEVLHQKIKAILGQKADFNHPQWLAKSAIERTELKQRSIQSMTWYEVPGTALRQGNILPTNRISRISSLMNMTAGNYGIEFRHPLMDRRIIEFFLKIPIKMMYRGGVNRLTLRNAVKGLTPDEIRTKSVKPLFRSYLAERLSADQDYIKSLMTESRLVARGIADPQQLRVLYNEVEDKMNISYYLWQFATAEQWLRLMD